MSYIEYSESSSPIKRIKKNMMRAVIEKHSSFLSSSESEDEKEEEEEE
jgi:hypothetical protein